MAKGDGIQHTLLLFCSLNLGLGYAKSLAVVDVKLHLTRDVFYYRIGLSHPQYSNISTYTGTKERS